MHYFANQKVGTKITLVSAVMLFCLIAVALIGIQQLSAMRDKAADVYAVNLKALDAAKGADISLISASRALRNMILAPSPELQETYRKRFFSLISTTYDELNKVASSISKQEHVSLLIKTRAVLDDIIISQKHFIEQFREMPPDELFKKILAIRTQVDAVDDAMLTLAAAMDTEAETRTAEIALIYQRGQIFSLVGLLVALILGGSIGYRIKKSIAQPLELMADKAALVAAGDLNQNFKLARKDELGQLAAALDQMVANLCWRIAETEQKNHELNRTRFLFLRGMASLAETRDLETGDHIARVSKYIKILAEHIRAQKLHKYFSSREVITELGRAAILHDIGKVGVPDNILLKPGKLTLEEFEIMKQHTFYGEGIIKKLQKVQKSNMFLMHAAEIAGGHHECWDGSGYPRGLKGTEIPLSARLMAIADVYDAIVSSRVYKKAQRHEDAVRFIMEQKGIRFDPDIVEIFYRHQAKFEEIASRFVLQDQKSSQSVSSIM